VIEPPLLLVTDRKQASAPLLDILAAAFAAGCRWASLREKDLTSDEQIRMARGLLPVARRWGARLTLHGEPSAAMEAGLDGVHLAGGANAAAARAMIGPDAVLGISIHNAAEARALDRAVIDYAIAGPAFETASKPGYGPALGIAGIAEIAGAAAVPVIAIGGITAERVAVIMSAGAAGIATMGSVMKAPDAGAEISALQAALAQPRAR
jgi:thiamine-phosphate pyrophosphorylase